MKKKIFALTASAILCISGAAQAASYSFGQSIEAMKFQTGYLAAYNSADELCGASKVQLKHGDNNEVTCEDVSFASGDVAYVKLYIINEDGAVTILRGSETASPEEPTPAPTPTPAPSTSPDFSDYPSVYQKEAYAMCAPAMVKKVNESFEDGETVYKVKLLYCGKEQDFTFDSDFLIKQASDSYSDLIGSNASVLKSGDIISLGFGLKDTPPKDMCLLYRPTSDPVLSEDSFLSLFTTEGLAGKLWRVNTDSDIGYSFGIVTKVRSQYITISGISGKTSDEYDIRLADDTVVYDYQLSDAKSAEITSTGAVFESEVSDECKDSDGNITKWDPESDRCYVLVRTIDGKAADIMVFHKD